MKIIRENVILGKFVKNCREYQSGFREQSKIRVFIFKSDRVTEINRDQHMNGLKFVIV